MAKWMKLDLDFYRDPKVRKLAKDKGESQAWRWLKLTCLAAEQYGCLDMTDPLISDWVKDEMGMSAQRLDKLVSDCLECRLFDREAWEASRRVTSARMVDEGSRMLNSEQQRSAAGRASGRARRAKKEAEE